MPVWPASLPSPFFPDVAIEPQEMVARTNMEKGPPRTRVLTWATPTTYSLRAWFNREQYGVFEAWHRYTLKNGSLWFDLMLPGGAGTQSVTALMLEWQARSRSNRSVAGFEVNFKVLTRSRPMMSEAELGPYL